MKLSSKIILSFILLLSAGKILAEENKESINVDQKQLMKDAKKVSEAVDDPMSDFKETKFLQVDRVLVPKELSKIEDQVRQNILDVILISKTHTPIYSQKRDGYSDSYKKFFGLQVTIAPAPKKEDSFDVSFSYYNWTTNKFDKSLYKQISKYNVLNELRFGMYELLFGKEYVSKNRDVIDVQNYERIQVVRKAIKDQERFEKKKKKEQESKSKEEESFEKKNKKKIIREDKEKQIKPSGSNVESSPESEESSALSSNEEEDFETDEHMSSPLPKDQKIARNRSAKSAKSASKPKISKDTPTSPEPPAGAPPVLDRPNKRPETKYVSNLLGQVGILYDSITSITSDKKIKTFSDLKYVGLGGKFEIKEDNPRPLSYLISIKLGIPVMKENYTIPIYKSLDATLYKHDLLVEKLRFGAGIQYCPTNFVNVPDFGGTLQVFENNLVWLKGSVGYQFSWNEMPMNIESNAYMSLFMSSNQGNTNLTGSKIELLADVKLAPKFGLSASVAALSLSGDLEVSGINAQLFGTYYFEN